MIGYVKYFTDNKMSFKVVDNSFVKKYTKI